MITSKYPALKQPKIVFLEWVQGQTNGQTIMSNRP